MTGNKISVAFCTLGCKVNQYETDAMHQLFQEKGYEIVPFSQKADVYVINTCTVTNMADRKSRQMLHRAKKHSPESIVVAVGCYAQAAGEKLLEDPYIDVVVGNNRKKDIVSIIESYMAQTNQEKSCWMVDVNHDAQYEQLDISQVSEHTRAYIKIQDGCNQFCTYCIIPFARGRVRSRQLEDILAEVKRLADHGYKEVVLTGIHISSYGLDFEGVQYNGKPENGQHMLELIQAIDKIPGIARIRLGSLEPRIITENFTKELANISKVCPHFHLSLQSGCDDTLKRMNRHYTTDQYKQGCDILRKYFENPAITTDVIVGFPGETEEEFNQSKQFLETIGFSSIHVFKYSRRQGTKAAEMPEQVPEQVKSQRSDILLKLVKEMSATYENLWKNKPLEVLLEEETEILGRKYMIGHTKTYIKVGIPAHEGEENQIITAKATGEENEEFMICKRID